MAVKAVTMNIKDGNELKSYTVLDKKVSENDSDTCIFDGKNYTKTKLSDGSYRYMLPSEGEEITLENESIAKEPTATFFSFNDSKYDRAVDSAFDVVDRLMGTDNTNLTSDGENDGKISWWEKAKRAFKGGVITPLKSIIKHPIATLGAVAGVALAGVAAAAVGISLTPILLGAGLVIGAATLIHGGFKAYNAKTDAEARAAWENIGSGIVTSFLSAKALCKLAPSDPGVVRSGIDKLTHNLGRIRTKDITPSNDGIIRKTFYRPLQFKRTLGITVTPNEYEATITQAKNFATTGKWHSLGLELQKLKRLAQVVESDSAKTAIQNSIKDLTVAYKTGMAATTPTKTLAFTGSNIIDNWTDHSSRKLQELYDTTPAFAN